MIITPAILLMIPTVAALFAIFAKEGARLGVFVNTLIWVSAIVGVAAMAHQLETTHNMVTQLCEHSDTCTVDK